MSQELVQTAMEFVIEDDVKSLQSLFKKYPEIVEHSFVLNKNWLHKASDYETPKVIDFLVSIFDIESMDRFGRTPLCTALISDEIIPTKKLIELGANVNQKGGGSPLSHAVYSQSKELLKLLIENGANNETKEELIRFGRGQGYKKIEEDLNELNYVSAVTETFKDKLITHYGELTDVQCKESPCVLYSKQAKGKFTVYSDNISKNPEIPFEIMFEVTKQGFDTAEKVLTQSYPWLFDWLEVISQVDVDLTQRVMIITREVECTPYQGVALLTEEQINCNDTLVYIYRVFPLYQKEIEFEKQYGIAALFKKFEEQGVSQTILKTRKPIK